MSLPALLLATGLLAGAFVAAHRVAGRSESRRFPPPGRLVDVGGYRIHLDDRGEGAPTVVLDAALAGTSLSWHRIQPEVATFARAVSYDRAGFGWSDPAPSPRRVDVMVEELRRVLTAASIGPPYVLVGHSYGGWIARLFASRYRDEVAGLVLVDVPHPREWSDPTEAQRRRVARGAELARRGALLAEVGVIRALYRAASQGLLLRASAPGEQGRIQTLLDKLPEELRAPIRSFWVKPATLRSLASLIENAPSSAAMLETVELDLGERPLVVLTAASPSEERLRDQEEVLGRSRNAHHVISTTSGHWIPLEEPELVVSAIRRVVDAVRESS